MKKYLIGGVVALVVLIGGGAAWIWFSGGSGDASAPVTAPPIETTEAPSEPATTAPPGTVTDTTTERMSETTAVPTSEQPTATGAMTLTIDPTQSEARFLIDEELRGSPITVTGATDQVTGEILFDVDDPASAQLGTIVINVRTLATDSGFRDRAIRGQILQSNDDAFEFATFAPTTVEGLPDAIEVGDTVTLTVVGDLTLRTITAPVTFTVDVTVAGSNRLEGFGTATVLRDDFELRIPSAPGVANVSEEVTLELDFVAVSG